MQKDNARMELHTLLCDQFKELGHIEIDMRFKEGKKKQLAFTYAKPAKNKYVMEIYSEALDYPEDAFRAILALELGKIAHGLPNSKGLMRYIPTQILVYCAVIGISLFAGIKLSEIIVPKVFTEQYRMAMSLLVMSAIIVGVAEFLYFLRRKFIHRIPQMNRWAEKEVVRLGLGKDLLKFHVSYHDNNSVFFTGGMTMVDINEAIQEQNKATQEQPVA